MRKTLTLAAALLFAISMQAAELTVDEVLAKNTTAKGGIDKIRAVKSVKFTGKMSFGPMEAPFVMTKKRPEFMKVDFTLPERSVWPATSWTRGSPSWPRWSRGARR